MKSFDKFCGIISKIFAVCAALFLVIIVATCFMQAFTRYFMGHTWAWTEEAARYSFAWCMMLASVSCCYSRSHSGVTILNDMFRGNMKHIHQALLDLAFAFFGVLMIIYGIQLAENQSTVISALLHVPMWAVYAAIPVGGAGIALMNVNNVLRDITAMKKTGDASPDMN